MDVIYLLAGFVIGALIIFLVMKVQLIRSYRQADEEKSHSEQERIRFDEQLKYIQQTVQEYKERKDELEKLSEDRLQDTVRLDTENHALQKNLLEQEENIKKIQEQFTEEFEKLAARILKQNSTEFTDLNQRKMSELLAPLKERIQLFERKVDETYEKGLKDQTDLRAELKKLQDLNQRISQDAVNLTKALKGDVKKQGNWGEMILERILERSGLTEGREYEKQFSQISDDGNRLQPDVLIHLPDNKHIIVDSKVSLVAYERLVNADNDQDYQLEMKNHLTSIRQHVKELSDKHYQSLPGINSPDFVLLFLPIESSFSVAVQADQQLFSYAWDHKVVIVSPSTLLATLRTIASIWQQENQTRHALEIAKQGGKLYDKFVRFVGDMEKIGSSLDAAQKNYTGAMNKLTEGRGNLVRSSEKLREMGARTNKELSNKYMADSEDGRAE